LPSSWLALGKKKGWPSGICADGTRLETTVNVTEVDKKAKIWKATKTTTAYYTSGIEEAKTRDVQTHPASALEIEPWLQANEFQIVGRYSSPKGTPYAAGCSRAIFWATKNG